MTRSWSRTKKTDLEGLPKQGGTQQGQRGDGNRVFPLAREPTALGLTCSRIVLTGTEGVKGVLRPPIEPAIVPKTKGA